MLYFAYGSNMSVTRMRSQCPNAELVGVASLRNHSLILNLQGVATVISAPGSKVWGVLWNLSEHDREALDWYEAVDAGMHRPATRTVTGPDGEEAEALLYVAPDDRPGRPQPDYVQQLIEAAREHGLPGVYMRTLQGWLAE